jgi:hypothetical protein
LQCKIGRHVVKRNGRLFTAGCRLDFAPTDGRACLQAKGRGRIGEVGGGPIRNGKAVQFDAAALNDHGMVDKVDDDVGLRARGELDLLGKYTSGLLERGRIIEIDLPRMFRLCGAGKRSGEDQKQEEKAARRLAVHSIKKS